MNDAFDPKAAAEKHRLKELAVVEIDPQACVVRWTDDGAWLLAGGFDARVRRYKLDKNEAGALTPTEIAPATGHNGWVHALAVGPDGATAYSGDSWGQFRAWSLAAEDPQPLWRHDTAHDGWLRDIAVSPDGKTVATCGADRKLRLWSNDGAPLHEATEPRDLYSLKFTPDGARLFVGDRFGGLAEWDVAGRTVVKRWDATILYKYDRIQDVGGVRTIAFDATGATMAVGGLKPQVGATIQGIPTLLFFDKASGELRHTRELGGPNDCDVMGVAFHPEGFFVAVCSGGPGVGKFVFQRPRDAEPFFVETKIANCRSMTLSTDGRRLAIGGTNRDSNGNGRVSNPDGSYRDNRSPVHLFEIGAV